MQASLQNIFGLEGRCALVTGSSRGIGAVIAQALAAAGAHVFVHGHSEGSADATRDSIQNAGGSAQALHGDLSQTGRGTFLIETCENTYGQLDILVINASAQINAQLHELTAADLSMQIDVNLRSTIEMLQFCLPLMAERGWGRIVNIGSINQERPKPEVTAYAALKAAQHNIIKSQARRFAQSGVLLNTLAPGLVDTDRNAARKHDPDAWLAYTQQVNWMGRAGDPKEMAGAALLLASDACSFMTGEVVKISGGM